MQPLQHRKFDLMQPSWRSRARAVGLLSVACLSLSNAAWSATAQETLQQAAQALGTQEFKSIEYSGSGTDYALGQAGSGKLPWPRFNLVRYTNTVSFEPWASRLEFTRTQFENPARGGGRQPIIGEQDNTNVVIPGSPQAANLPIDMAMAVPQQFIKQAGAAADVMASTAKRDGKSYTLITYTAANKAKTRGWFNDQHLLEHAETTTYHNVLGNLAYESTLTDYKDFNGIKFPGHIMQKLGGYPVLDLNVSAVKTNVTGNFQPAGPPPAGALTSEQLAENIYLITGGYASIAVGFKDHVTVIEAAQSEQRASAVIAEVKRLFPGKPITEVVNTHPHFDHLGGVRTLVAEGATVIAHKANKAYLQQVLTHSHSLMPDALEKNPRKPVIKTVDDHMTLTDGSITVELYHQQNLTHQDGMLLAYLPKEKILIQADSFNPPPALMTQSAANPNPYTVNLVTNVERLKLDVQRVIPIHLPAGNRKVSFNEVLLAAGKAGTP